MWTRWKSAPQKGLCCGSISYILVDQVVEYLEETGQAYRFIVGVCIDGNEATLLQYPA